MKRVGLIYDDVFLKHETPQWHPETKERLRAVVAGLKSDGLWDEVEHIPARKAGADDLKAVHDPAYVEKIMDARAGYLDPDTYFSGGTLEASLFAAGAVMEAIKQCHEGKVERAFCAVRPPGHHAEADRAMGFCIFNNIAVGARYAQRLGYKKVFIADFDVHHGNGTEHMFYQDDSVFYFSTHQYPHYPGTGSERDRGRGKGEGFTYNIPMSSGSGDREYGHVYNETLHELVRDFEPDIFLVSAGYDIHARDPLAAIRVTDGGIKSIVRGILTSRKDIPYVFALEGGYDLEALASAVSITIQALLEE